MTETTEPHISAPHQLHPKGQLAEQGYVWWRAVGFGKEGWREISKDGLTWERSPV